MVPTGPRLAHVGPMNFAIWVTMFNHNYCVIKNESCGIVSFFIIKLSVLLDRCDMLLIFVSVASYALWRHVDMQIKSLCVGNLFINCYQVPGIWDIFIIIISPEWRGMSCEVRTDIVEWRFQDDRPSSPHKPSIYAEALQSVNKRYNICLKTCTRFCCTCCLLPVILL